MTPKIRFLASAALMAACGSFPSGPARAASPSPLPPTVSPSIEMPVAISSGPGTPASSASPAAGLPPSGVGVSAIAWRNWQPGLFKPGANPARPLVVLDLEAIWCHWCHAMDERTYADPRVIRLLGAKAVAVRVDQDSRPDLAKRYEDYGWPATIFFDSEGHELAKRAGFIEPDEMVELLEKLAKKPVPEKGGRPAAAKPAETPQLSAALRAELRQRHVDQYDAKSQGWGRTHKFLFGESEELALRDAWLGKPGEADDVAARAAGLRMGKGALTAALALIDPAWGGAYQYSVGGWREPHFEKIAQKQADNLFLYSLGFGVTGDPKYAAAAAAVAGYLAKFLTSPEGAFYTSQDADLVKGVHGEGYFKLGNEARRAQGVPAVDRSIYARENGWLIQALGEHYAMTGEERSLAAALQAAKWIQANRALEGGGFTHGAGAGDAAGPYLGDSLEMGGAFLKLYEITADRTWLQAAQRAGQFIADQFAGPTAGFLPARRAIADTLPSEPARDENLRVARFYNLLWQLSGDTQARAHAEAAMRFVATPERARERPTAGVILADLELSQAPVHMTVVGAKNDPAARALFRAALRIPADYRRLEWWDPAEGPLPHADVTYPQLSKAAAFACSGARCSVPLTDPETLRARLEKLLR